MATAPEEIFSESVADFRLEEIERRARDQGSRLPLREWLALAEAWRIARALRETGGNRSAAARQLGIGRRTLYTKMAKLRLVPTWGIAAEDRPNGSNGAAESV